MTTRKSTAEKDNMARWVKFSKENALRLLAHADELALTVFSSPDNFFSFLELTSRLHFYDARNLLLIWEKCPSASCLAGFKVWERYLPPGSQVLKKEHIGNAIDLIAPFTDGSDEQRCLVWYNISMFDVSQTMVQSTLPSFDFSYVSDDHHEYFLLDALKYILGSKFQRSIIIQPPNRLMRETGLFGQVTENAVILRDDLSALEMLQWLTETVVHLFIEGKNLSSPVAQLMRNCVRYCLFRIWDLEASLQAPSGVQLEAVVSGELVFLNLLRDTLRELNVLCCSIYLSLRKQDDGLDDFDLEELLDLPQI